MRVKYLATVAKMILNGRKYREMLKILAEFAKKSFEKEKYC
jgi:hypothetical protein